MKPFPEIKLYGANGCHKSQYYALLLQEKGLDFKFLDVETNQDHANELRELYTNGKLNYPTITIGAKKLRNPTKEELSKWIDKLIPERIPLVHDIDNARFTLLVAGELAKVTYRLEGNTMYLTHSEVPYTLRGIGIGKVLVEKTFEKLKEEGYDGVAICSFIKATAQRSQKWKENISY